MRHFLTFIVLFLAAVPVAVQADWQADGERLTFDVGLGFVPVGQSEILYKPEENKKYSIIARAWTNSGLGTFFTMRDRIIVKGSHKEQDFITQTYHLNLNENDYRADKIVTYKRDIGEAAYQNIRAGHGPIGYHIQANTRDLLSMLYYLRKNHPKAKPGDSYTLPTFDLERHFTTEVKVLERQRMKTIFGKQDVLYIRLYMTEQGKEKVKDNWSLWVTDDGQYIPVKIKVNLKFGSFTSKLVRAEKAKSPSNAPKGLGEEGDIKLPERKLDYANPLED